MQHQWRVIIFAFSIEHRGTIELDGFDLVESELRL